VDVLTNPLLPDLKDKFVLIGSSSTGLFDLKQLHFQVLFLELKSMPILLTI